MNYSPKLTVVGFPSRLYPVVFRFCSMFFYTAVGVFASVVVVADTPAPVLRSIMPRGLETGAPTLLVLEGEHLDANLMLIATIPIAKQTLRPGATATRVEIEVTLDAGIPAGWAALWTTTNSGISKGLVMAVDSLPQRGHSGWAESIDTMPVALSGSVRGAEIRKVSFDGKQGQPFAVEVESKRFGSTTRGVLRLLDASGVPIASSTGLRELAGDPRIMHTLPKDGRYTIEFHDLLFRAADPGFFRMKVGQWGWSDLAMPLAIRRGSSSPVVPLSSSLPAGVLLSITAPVTYGSFPLELPAPSRPAGPNLAMFASDFDEVLESSVDMPPGDMNAQPIPFPAGVTGRISVAGQRDRYRIAVTPESSVRIALESHAMGSPLDGILVVRTSSGAQIAAADDQPGNMNPTVVVKIPANTDAIVVDVGDVRGHGGDLFVYRLTVTPEGFPDPLFTLDTESVSIHSGGTSLVRASVDRRGWNGPIDLAVSGLPAATLIAGTHLDPGQSSALLSIHVPAGSAAFAGLLQISATLGTDASRMQRNALVPLFPGTLHHSWLRKNLALAILPSPPLLATDWQQNGNTSQWLRGTKLSVPINITLQEGATGTVRLSLVSTQPVPTKVIKENNVDKTVPDIDRSLRFESDVPLAINAGGLMPVVVIPGDLEERAYDVVVIAELLSADANSVIARSSSSSRRVLAVSPFSIQLISDPKIVVKSSELTPLTVSGRLTRHPALMSAIRVSVAGLPDGTEAPSVEIPVGQQDFVLNFTMPAGLDMAKLAELKIVAQCEGFTVTIPLVAQLASSRPIRSERRAG